MSEKIYKVFRTIFKKLYVNDLRYNMIKVRKTTLENVYLRLSAKHYLNFTYTLICYKYNRL